MTKVLISVVLDTTTEVDVDEARNSLVSLYGFQRGEVDQMSPEEAAEVYVSFADGDVIDLTFDRNTHALEVCDG